MAFSKRFAGRDISLQQLELIKLLYPHAAAQYPELKRELAQLLLEYPQADLSDEDEVLARSRRDEKGTLQTIVLVNAGLASPHWRLVGHDGHTHDDPLSMRLIAEEFVEPYHRRYLAEQKRANEQTRRRRWWFAITFVLSLSCFIFTVESFYRLNWLEDIGAMTILSLPSVLIAFYITHILFRTEGTYELERKVQWEQSKRVLEYALC